MAAFGDRCGKQFSGENGFVINPLRQTLASKTPVFGTEDRMARYIIRAVLNEETNDGWVWMTLPSRAIVRIRSDSGTVFCQVRKIDPNFLTRYNDRTKRIPITKPAETIVMAEWYRDALGGFGATDGDDRNGGPELDVKQLRRWGWFSLRAACHHPDDVARLGTRLGVLGAWLGIVSLMLAALSVLKADNASNDWNC